MEDDKTFIHYDISANPKSRTSDPMYGDWEIASITDSTMVWTQKLTGIYGVVVGNEFETDYDYTYTFRKKE